MKYEAIYLCIGQGPFSIIFDSDVTGEDNLRQEAWRRAAFKEGVNPEKIELLNCESVN